MDSIFDKHFEEWLEIKSKTWAIGTLNDVKVKSKRLYEFFKGYEIKDINEISWEKFLGYMNAKHKGKRVSKIQDYLSSFLRYCFNLGLIERIPKLRSKDKPSEIGRPLSDSEVEIILNNINTDKLRLQIYLQLYMGMRAGEVMSLEKADINISTGMIKLQAEKTKTRRSRSIPIHKNVLPLLLNQIQSSPSRWLFPSPLDISESETNQGNRSAFQSLLKRSGIKCRRHDLRHTCATRMARRGVPPMIACRILGMSLRVYDQVYCKPNEEDLKNHI